MDFCRVGTAFDAASCERPVVQADLNLARKDMGAKVAGDRRIVAVILEGCTATMVQQDSRRLESVMRGLDPRICLQS
jgi:hypothetical protein